MNSIIHYFNNAPDLHRILLLLGTFFVLWNLEIFIEIATGKSKLKHLILNAKFMLTAAPVQVGLSFLMNYTLHWTQKHNFGLMRIFRIENQILLFLGSFVFLDFCEYVYHVMMHKSTIFWKFHLVHHVDTDLDVSSTFREHPGETTLRLLFTTLWVFIGGITLWTLIFRQFIQIVSNVIAHTSIRIPEKLDAVLSYVFVTPNFHHVHHHFVLPYTDTNYGDVLSIWDRIFGTFGHLEKSQIVFGIDTHQNPNRIDTFKKLLILPSKSKIENDKNTIDNFTFFQ
jgi:sterol desaturase/sphingolipid hydroxylase (fatty acid hydroxylase superfamily)